MNAAAEQRAPRTRRWFGFTLAHEVPRAVGDYHWIYLWGVPLRLMHWAAVLSLVLLVITGFYIGRPYFMTGGEASAHYLMGWMRFFHFVAAGVLVATAIVRVYWLFVGNRFERWRALFPVTKRDWVNLGKLIRAYLFIRPEERPEYLGHNPLQQIFYTLTYLVTFFMILTGFLLYSQSNPTGFMYATIGWITPLIGGNQMVRLIHHVLPWYYPFFVILHVYLVVRSDSVERTGTVSSMIGGGRFVPVDEQHVDE